MLFFVNNYFARRTSPTREGECEAFALHCPAMARRNIFLFFALFALALPCLAQETVQDVVERTMLPRHAHRGTAVVLDIRMNKILAGYELDIAARRLATPGSTVKSFVLLKLL